MIEDLRLGARTLWRRRRASRLAIVVLTLGIGLATSMWSLLDGVLLRGLPFPEGDRIVMVSTARSYDRPMPVEDFRALRERRSTFTEIAAFRTYNSVMTRPEVGSKGLTATYVTGNLFETLGVEPILGRSFSLADEDPGSPPVAILSQRVWKTQFGGDPDVLGKTAILNREPMTIVGVMPEGFHFPIRQEAWAAWRPRGRSWSDASAFVIAKLRPEQDAESASLELAPDVAELDAERPLSQPRQVHVRGFVDAQIPAAVQRSLEVLLAAAFGILLIACANAANLKIGETLARADELAVRRALGASGTRTLRLLVAEGIVLVGLGAACGLALAWGLTHWVARALLDGSLLAHQFWVDVRLDLRAGIFAVAAAALAVLLSGVVPAWWSLRRGSEGARRLAGGRVTGGRRETRLAMGLVTGEVAICFALAVGAALLAASAVALVSPTPGFDASHLMRAIVNTYPMDAETPAARRRFWETLIPELEADPTVAGVTLASSVPWGPNATWAAVRSDPTDDTPVDELPRAQIAQVLPGYFETLRWPLLSGRALERRDVLAREFGGDAELPVVVSESFARRHFAGSPLGRLFDVQVMGSDRPVRASVVGVVTDRGLGRTDQAFSEDLVFTPFAFAHGAGGFLIARGHGSASGLMKIIDREIARIDPRVATLDERTYVQERAEQTWTERRLAQLLALFAATSLVLCGVGLYGVVTLSLRRRRRELAIRAVLGALPRRLCRLLLGQGGRSVGSGLAVGAALTWWTGSFLERFLYRVDLWDARVIGTSVVSVASVALVAMLGPAISAARTDAAELLRSE